jgi:hypothetical protein
MEFDADAHTSASTKSAMKAVIGSPTGLPSTGQPPTPLTAPHPKLWPSDGLFMASLHAAVLPFVDAWAYATSVTAKANTILIAFVTILMLQHRLGRQVEICELEASYLPT